MDRDRQAVQDQSATRAADRQEMRRERQRLDVDVFKIVLNCATCGNTFWPTYAFKTRKYCSLACSRNDPANAARRLEMMRAMAATAAKRRTEKARKCFCSICGGQLLVADPRVKTCGARACMSELFARKKMASYKELRDMPRYYAKGRKDSNQQKIVEALEAAGCHTIDMSDRGGGFPDLIVWRRGETHLVEIKNPTNAYGKSGANKNQTLWAENWPMPIFILTSVNDVELFINGKYKELKWYGQENAIFRVINKEDA